jgi:uncharacterized membrane protein (DUF2068 family)
VAEEKAPPHVHPAIRTIAIVEAAKGALVFLVGFGLLSLIHRDVEHFAERLVVHAHLNPASHIPKIFLEAASRTTDAHLWAYAALAAAYGIVRLVEGYGLWRERRWAEWLAALSAGIYIPFEVWHVMHRHGWISVAALILNILIVAVMVNALQKRSLSLGRGPG